jgi:hypothetical protein
MSKTNKSPFFSFLKIIFCFGLIFGAYVIGDNLGYKRGFQETANFTATKLGIDKTVVGYDEYDTILDAYIVENKSVDKSIENIFSTDGLGERAGSLVTNFINSLFGE